MKYICGQVFMPCISTTVGALTLSLPSLPCRTHCTDFATDCAPLIYVNSALKPNCTGQGARAPGKV
jgi:hypothetical protein